MSSSWLMIVVVVVRADGGEGRIRILALEALIVYLGRVGGVHRVEKWSREEECSGEGEGKGTRGDRPHFRRGGTSAFDLQRPFT